MKAKIIVIIVIFIIMGIIPVITMRCNILETDKTSTPTEAFHAAEESTESQNVSNEEIIKGLVFAQYSENMSDEVLKAVAVILQTNYKNNSSSFDLTDKSIYLSDEDMKSKYNDSFEEINKKINDATNSVKEIYIYINNEIAYIPFSACSPGFTSTDEKYPDLISVASPWDCLSNNFSEENTCTGVSIDGIIYLTENNNDYKTALMWYLPKYQIK